MRYADPANLEPVRSFWDDHIGTYIVETGTGFHVGLTYWGQDFKSARGLLHFFGFRNKEDAKKLAAKVFEARQIRTKFWRTDSPATLLFG